MSLKAPKVFFFFFFSLFCALFYFLRQAVMQTRLSLKSLCRQRWAWAHERLDSISCSLAALAYRGLWSQRWASCSLDEHCAKRATPPDLLAFISPWRSLSLKCTFEALTPCGSTAKQRNALHVCGDELCSDVWGPKLHSQLWKQINRQTMKNWLILCSLSGTHPIVYVRITEWKFPSQTLV